MCFAPDIFNYMKNVENAETNVKTNKEKVENI